MSLSCSRLKKRGLPRFFPLHWIYETLQNFRQIHFLFFFFGLLVWFGLFFLSLVSLLYAINFEGRGGGEM